MSNEIMRRLRAKTPKFFKKLQKLTMSLSVVSVTALGFKEELPDYTKEALPHLLTAGLVGTLLTQLTEEKDKEKSDQL